MDVEQSNRYALDKLQKTALSLMTMLMVVTFVGTNLQAVLWQSSQWLVSTVLPATVIDLTNQERSELSQAPLVRNKTLDAAAKLKAQHMADNEYFSHFSPDGTSPWHWFKEAGYVYAHAGENLAIHFTDSTEVVEAWMKSPAHRENIVNGKYSEIGVGTAKGSYEGYDTVYVVQLFAAPGVSLPAAAAPVVLPPASEPESESVLPPTEPVIVSPVPGEVVSESVAPSAPAVEEPVLTEVSMVAPPVEVTPEVVLEAPPLTGLEQQEETVVIESPVLTTSSGLAVANITVDNPSHAGATAVASIATQPNVLLQIVYLGLGFLIFLLLTASLVMEARQLRFVQVAYSVLLLCGMGSLWVVNSMLTSGAVII